MYHISNDQRSKNSADYIFEALTLLLKEKTYEEITISELVKKAGVGRTTFYRCFDTLYDVLQYRSDCIFQSCTVFLHDKILIEKKYMPEQTFIIPFLDFWAQHTAFVKLLIHIDQVTILIKSFRKMIEQLTTQYPQVPIDHYAYFVEIRSAIAIAILTQWVKDDLKLSPAELAQVLKDKILLDQFLYDTLMNT